MTMDIAAFTDDRPDDLAADIAAADSTLLFTTGSLPVASGGHGLSVIDDQIAGRSVTSETMSIGLNVSANLGKVVPYFVFSYDSEDTTAAAYKAEVGTDGNNAETAASNYANSMTIGGGLNFMLGSHISGGIRAGMITGREDWEEDYLSGNISIGF